MTMALDPLTYAPNPDLSTTDVNTTFDASAQGHYELQGLLPGIFDLYVFANGYQTALFASGVTVHSGQNLSYDAYVTVTSISTVTSTSTTTEMPLPGIPGFPIEAILAGFIIGIFGLALMRRARARVGSWKG
jgi:hypothetical protein